MWPLSKMHWTSLYRVPPPAHHPLRHQTWDLPSPISQPPYYGHLVAITRDLYKLVHLRTLPSPWEQHPIWFAMGGMHPTGMLSCYHPQFSWGKVMFLHMSVILFMGGVSVPACTTGHITWGLSREVSVQGGLCLGGLCPGGVCWGSLSKGVSIKGGVSVRETPRTVTSGRYASYWNAFLLIIYSLKYDLTDPQGCGFAILRTCLIITFCNLNLKQSYYDGPQDLSKMPIVQNTGLGRSWDHRLNTRQEI